MINFENKPVNSPKAVSLTVKCRDCFYYKRGAIFSDGENTRSCSNLGVQPASYPCEKFSPDAQGINFKDRKVALNALRDFISQVNDRELTLAAALVNRERLTRKHGYYFGQEVYLKAFGSNYLANWYKATVICVDKKYVYAQGLNGSRWMVHHSSVMLPERWKAVHQELLEKKLIVDKKWAKETAMHRADLKELRNPKYRPPWLPDNLKMDKEVGIQQKVSEPVNTSQKAKKLKIKKASSVAMPTTKIPKFTKGKITSFSVVANKDKA